MRISKHKLCGRRKGGYKWHNEGKISQMVCACPDLSKVEKTVWEARMEQKKTGVMKTEVETEIQIIKRQSILICSYLKEWQKRQCAILMDENARMSHGRLHSSKCKLLSSTYAKIFS